MSKTLQPMSNLGRLIRIYRASTSESQGELAKRMGLTPTTLSRIERGSTNLDSMFTLLRWLFSPED